MLRFVYFTTKSGGEEYILPEKENIMLLKSLKWQS